MASRKETSAVSPGAKGGRPSKFDRRFVDQAFNLALLGLTEPEMAAVLGVTRQTLNNWRKSQPGFFDAITRGKTAADAKVARAMYERALGYSHPETVITSYQGVITKTRVTRHYPPDQAAAAQWLYNRQGTRWRRDPDPIDSGDEAPPPTKVVIEVKSARKRHDDADPE